MESAPRAGRRRHDHAGTLLPLAPPPASGWLPAHAPHFRRRAGRQAHRGPGPGRDRTPGATGSGTAAVAAARVHVAAHYAPVVGPFPRVWERSMAKSTGKVTIKKYANRRLYDTETSAYITLDRLAAMVREGREFEVIDAKTGEDITRQVLTQIIVDEEARGSTMLPINFLKQLIGLYGNSMQGMVPQYLEAAMDAFQRNQSAMRDAFGGKVFADIAKRNMEMFE